MYGLEVWFRVYRVPNLLRIESCEFRDRRLGGWFLLIARSGRRTSTPRTLDPKP